jgi:hypothetical protein
VPLKPLILIFVIPSGQPALYHSGYVSWKYAKAWELSRKNRGSR